MKTPVKSISESKQAVIDKIEFEILEYLMTKKEEVNLSAVFDAIKKDIEDENKVKIIENLINQKLISENIITCQITKLGKLVYEDARKK